MKMKKAKKKSKSAAAAFTESEENPLDLVTTIDDEAKIDYQSDDSDAEEDFQPSKIKKRKIGDFNDKFQFVSSAKDYQKDTWDDLMSFVKRRTRGLVGDKIAKVISARDQKKQRELELSDDDEAADAAIKDEELDLSDDELQHDNIRIKEKKGRKRKAVETTDDDGVEVENFFEEAEQNGEEITSFYQMNLSRPLMKAIGVLGYIYPTPIQAATIPIALLGRDICGCAATGTGKTAAYMLPTLERLLFKPSTAQSVTRVLVLVPTRELGAQVYQVTKQLCQFTSIEIGMAIGGLDVKAQEAILRRNPDIVIATPGRLIDHIKNTPSFTLDSIEVLILDEADRMLDEYFAAQMEEIIKSCSRTRQTMLFSATMTDEVKDLAAVSLSRPVKVFVNNNQTVAFNLRQEFIRIREGREADREPLLAALVCRTFHDHCMVFVQTKKAAHRLRILLGLLGVKAGELHGDLSQAQRLESLKQFKDEQIDILIATDVAARGLDISGVKTVINFVMPLSVEHYIHRVGRTARAGRAGVSVSLAGESERPIVKAIVKRAVNPVKNRVIPPEIVDKYRRKVAALETEIDRVLEDERAEKMLAQTEQQLNRTEKKLLAAGGDATQPPRQWFQSQRQRQAEKERLAGVTANAENAAPKKPEKKQKRRRDDGSDLEDNIVRDPRRPKKAKAASKPKTPQEAAKERVQKELETAAATRAKLSKARFKLKRLRAVAEELPPSMTNPKKVQKTSGSRFALDLADTSKKSVKKLRYDANKKKKFDAKVKLGAFGGGKMSKEKLKNKAGLNKRNKGKHFGAPKQKKQRF